MKSEKIPTEELPTDYAAEKAMISLIASGGAKVLNMRQWSPVLFVHQDTNILFTVLVEEIQSGRMEGNPYANIYVDSLHRAQPHRFGDLRIGQITDILINGYPPEVRHPELHVPIFFERLNEALKKRAFISEAMKDIPAVRAGAITVEEAAAEIAKESAGLIGPVVDSKSMLEELDALFEGTPPESYHFGLPELDTALHYGVQRGEMCVISGKSGSGKSILLTMAAKSGAMNRAKPKVAYFSIEMPQVDIVTRIVSNLAGRRFRPVAEVTGEALDDLSNARALLAQAEQEKRLEVFATIDEIAEIERVVKVRHPDIVIVDYLQLVIAPGDSRVEQVSAVARRLKQLASTQKVAVLTASQINDDGELRESRSIGMDADIVLSIEGKNSEFIRIVKFRRGPRDQDFEVTMKGALARFEER